ncbi:MAG: RsmE family RNA methyltransferase [Candidatus Omnitrophica bacterium]|nr:RsmE family RNA methyltransferase [Candidatus Omnitrophota bacterium]
MSRFYVPKENVRGKTITVGGSEAKHIVKVMRLGVGDEVVIFDGTGSEYRGRIKGISPKAVAVDVIETRHVRAEDLPLVTLAQAIPKKEKMDYIVEKATELGVAGILPIVTDRTIVRFNERDRHVKVERWAALSREAAKQCGRTGLPVIQPVVLFKEAVAAAETYDHCFVAYLSDDTVPLKKALKEAGRGHIMVFIGPEGDFSPAEIALMRSTLKAQYVSLGQRVLKSDTAGLYVLSCINYEFT